MKISRSVNIERDSEKDLDYFVTANSIKVSEAILESYKKGMHSFSLIGSYGTGKSSFILEFIKSIRKVISGEKQSLINSSFKKYLLQYSGIEYINIVGEYDSLQNILASKLLINDQDSNDVLIVLKDLIAKNQLNKKITILSIDEFGKVLEFSSQNHPEREMYFLQKLSELINDIDSNSILLTTLHQGFESYSKKLDNVQKQEWTKVKGRFIDVVFAEPVEQLLHLTARRISEKFPASNPSKKNIEKLYSLALRSNFLRSDLDINTCYALYPMDIFAATIMTLANQQYGQNERTLFTFLESKGEFTISQFVNDWKSPFYNLSMVYDYLLNTFHDSLVNVHKNSTLWASIQNSIDRIWGYYTDTEFILDSIKVVKTIGLLNIFSSSASKVGESFLSTYGLYSLGISNIKEVLIKLKSDNIIRYANYKNKYILFEGSDFDIEKALVDAELALPVTNNFVKLLQSEVNLPLEIANAYYYRTGTPRYFEYQISEEPIGHSYFDKRIFEEIDGAINIILVKEENTDDIEKQILSISGLPHIYCVFTNTECIVKHLREIDKLNWILRKNDTNSLDNVARSEIHCQITYEKERIRELLTKGLFDKQSCKWYFNGEKVLNICSTKDLTKFLSKVCHIIYPHIPIFKNELVNKHKPSGNITSSRQLLLQKLIDNAELKDLGFIETKYPPEKSIYLSLIKYTGIHQKNDSTPPLYSLKAPSEESYLEIWKTCNDFMYSSIENPRKLKELQEILLRPPFGLKLGFLDFWIPLFLIIKKEEYVLYSNGRYIPSLNREVLELIQKSPESFTIKAFYIEGVKLDVFNKYRAAINLGEEKSIKNDTFIETIKPFLTYYNNLNRYTQNTSLVSPSAKAFRSIIKVATDPVKTFFEDLPDQLGFNEVVLANQPEAINTFVDAIQSAIKDLQEAYPRLLNNLEKVVLESLNISELSYLKYRSIIKNRYSNLNHNLLPLDVKRFVERLTTIYDDKQKWIESICYVFLNRPLDTISDSEVDYVISCIKKTLIALDDYIVLDNTSTKESSYRLHITTSTDGFYDSQVIVTSESSKAVKDLTKQIEKILDNNERINIAALATILKDKLRQNE